MKKILFFISVFTFLMINAQSPNLINNGGFEQTRSHLGQTKFNGWIFDRYLHVEKAQGYKGNNAVKMYTNSAYFRVAKAGEYNIIDVKGDTEYKLSFWVKGKQGIERIEPIITWYDSNGTRLSGGGKKYLGEVSSSSNWTKKTISFKAPSVAAGAGLAFKVFNSGDVIYMDEISLVKTSSVVLISPPTGLEIKVFQRELEMTWHKGKPNTKWEIMVNDKSEIVTSNHHIITGLIPNTNHTIKIRTILEKEVSNYTDEKEITTKNFIKSKEDPFRVPHIRTLKEEGTPNQTINLFYNDLYNLNAEISYTIDGEVVMPEKSKLNFPKKGKQVLKLSIKEEEGFEWEIEYKLNVK